MKDISFQTFSSSCYQKSNKTLYSHSFIHSLFPKSTVISKHPHWLLSTLPQLRQGPGLDEIHTAPHTGPRHIQPHNILPFNLRKGRKKKKKNFSQTWTDFILHLRPGAGSTRRSFSLKHRIFSSSSEVCVRLVFFYPFQGSVGQGSKDKPIPQAIQLPERNTGHFSLYTHTLEVENKRRQCGPLKAWWSIMRMQKYRWQ